MLTSIDSSVVQLNGIRNDENKKIESNNAEAGKFNLSRNSSSDYTDDGCCFAKMFISNLISLATRSKRKGGEIRGADPTAIVMSRKSATGCSNLISANLKSPTEMGICDSFDDEMLKRITHVPLGIDKNEWLATHTLSLFENINALCGTVSELCTPVSCPIMSYPGVPKAYWIDERKKQHTYSAMQYIDCVMTFCERSTKDESFYPTKHGAVFSTNFELHCRRFIQLLWHCCGHLYTNHWEQLALLNLRPQFSLVLAHMYTIAKIYGLMDGKELSAVSKTLQLVRPLSVYQNYSCGREAIRTAGAGVRWIRSPPSKSGSWGGHPSPAVSPHKAFSQTC